MQNCLKSLVFLFSLFSFVPGSTMAKKPELKISVQCKDQQCEFHGEDMWFHIAVHNAGAEPISAPVVFLTKKGPIVRLVDTRTQQETYLKSNLVDSALKTRLKTLKPGDCFEMDWIVTASELKQFNAKEVDLSAEFGISTNVWVGGAKEPSLYEATTAVHVVGRDADR